MKTVEYRVRERSVYYVTRFESDDEVKSAQSSMLGEYDKAETADAVAWAFSNQDMAKNDGTLVICTPFRQDDAPTQTRPEPSTKSDG